VPHELSLFSKVNARVPPSVKKKIISHPLFGPWLPISSSILDIDIFEYEGSKLTLRILATLVFASQAIFYGHFFETW
jgi:hypothetical protein